MHLFLCWGMHTLFIKVEKSQEIKQLVWHKEIQFVYCIYILSHPFHAKAGPLWDAEVIQYLVGEKLKLTEEFDWWHKNLSPLFGFC